MKYTNLWRYIVAFLAGVVVGAISTRSLTPKDRSTRVESTPLDVTDSESASTSTSSLSSADLAAAPPPRLAPDTDVSATPMDVTVWGPAEPKRIKPVGMGDVILGFVYSQVFAAIPVLILLAFTANALSPTATYSESESALMGAITSGPVVVLTMLLSWAGWMTAVWWAATRKGDRNWRELLKWRFKPSRDIPIGIGIAIAFRAYEYGVSLILQTLGVDTESLTNTSTITSQTGIWLVLLALGAAIGAPLVEEIFFRGLFLSVAVRNYGKVAAIIITSIIFGLMHVQPTLAGTLIIVTQTTLIGVVLAILVLKTNRLWSAICTHLAINISGVALALIFLS